MEFCEDCDNKLYLIVSKKRAQKAVASRGSREHSVFLYCKYCSADDDVLEAADDPGEVVEADEAAAVDDDDAAEDDDDLAGNRPEAEADMCIYQSTSTQHDNSLYFSTLVNRYSLNDATLPIVPTNETGHVCDADATIRYIRYDKNKMKFIYLCDKCLTCFTLNEPNKSLFDWKLEPPS